MIGVLASSAVDRGFEPRSCQPKTIKLVFVFSRLSMQHYGERAKNGWLGIRIMCPSGGHVYPRTVELVSVDLVQSGPDHHFIGISLVLAMI